MYGELEVQGSKNAVLPLMAASLLHRGVTVLDHVPDITDVACMVRILERLGAVVMRQDHRMVINATCLTSWEIPLEEVCRMRSSIIVLGALLARMGQAVTYYPGGCSIGSRPVDYHIGLMRDMGILIREEDGRIEAKAGHYHGAEIHLPFPSVGATENAILAATGAAGETVICGCAKEPEIVELCAFLQAMGIETVGAGTDRILVWGQTSKRDPHVRVSGDRIVAGTYLAAAAVAGGEICLTGAPVTSMSATLQALCSSGCLIQTEGDRITLQAPRHLRTIPHLETTVYPGFPTDMQSIMLAVQCCGTGVGRMEETIFEGRFETALQLNKMGGRILVDIGDPVCYPGHIGNAECIGKGHTAWVQGSGGLYGAHVSAADLRGGAALVVAGLGAQGETVVHQCHYIDRGYEDLEGNLQKLGARIHRVRDT